VLEQASGNPIETVEIRLVGVGSELRRITDSRGEFLFPRVPPGRYELVAEHLAYGRRADSILVLAGQRTTLELRLAMRPIELEPLVVRVRRQFQSARMVDFYERLQRGVGYFITREDIELRQPARIEYMVDEAPGVRLVSFGGRYAPLMRRYVRFTRSGSLESCWPAVYVDGVRVDQAHGVQGKSGPTFLDDFVLPNDVEAVEVYGGAAVVPAAFAGSDARCGVIAIWTRAGP
jgi:outer membrane cobalamin receptor